MDKYKCSKCKKEFEKKKIKLFTSDMGCFCYECADKAREEWFNKHGE